MLKEKQNITFIRFLDLLWP